MHFRGLRKKKMTLIQSHSCDKCGGALLIDIEKQIYICPFCGVTFDYDYFREDNVMDIADRALARGEFGSAKEAYEFMLQKEPHNFKALRGLLFCTLKVNKIHPIKDIMRNTLHAENQVVKKCIENTEAQGKVYFENLQKTGELSEQYKAELREIKKLERERTSVVKTMDAIDKEIKDNKRRFSNAFEYSWDELTPKMKEAAITLVGVFIILWISGIVMVGWWVFLLVAVPLALTITGYQIKKKRRDRELDAQYQPQLKKLGEIENEIAERRKVNEKTLKEYNEVFQVVFNADPDREDTTPSSFAKTGGGVIEEDEEEGQE